MAKGNFTHERVYPANAISENKIDSQAITHYKELVEKRRKARKYTQEDLYTIYNNIKAYFKRQRDEERPLTIAGLILAANVSEATWYEMLSGDYDYRLEQYTDIHNINIDTVTTFYDGMPCISDPQGNTILLVYHSEICKKALLMKEEETEERLYEKGRVGDIFALKSKHGWQEDNSPHTVNQTLVIASEAQARKAIEMLK